MCTYIKHAKAITVYIYRIYETRKTTYLYIYIVVKKKCNSNHVNEIH